MRSVLVFTYKDQQVTHTHTPTENNSPDTDTHAHDKKSTPTPQTNTSHKHLTRRVLCVQIPFDELAQLVQDSLDTHAPRPVPAPVPGPNATREWYDTHKRVWKDVMNEHGCPVDGNKYTPCN